MDLLSISPAWLFLGVFTVCFVFVVLRRGEDRFWLAPIVTWVVLVLALITLHGFTGNELSYREMERTVKPAPGDIERQLQTIAIDDVRTRRQQTDMLLIRLIGFHSFIALLYMGIGWYKTNQRYYRTAFLSFCFFVLVYAALEIRWQL
jgi:hypothetical protein